MKIGSVALACFMLYPSLLCAQQVVAPPPPPPTATAPTASASTTSSGPTADGKYFLRDGDDVSLLFAQELSSKTAAEGDPVEFILAEDLKVNGVVIAKSGAKAVGEVTNVKKAGMMGKAGELNIRLDYLKVGDTKVRLRGTKGKEGESGTGAAVALTVLFGPIGLIKHGKDIDIKQGTPLKAFVGDDIALPPAQS